MQLQDTNLFNEHILIRAARHSEENDRIAEAIKLYNLAGDYSTVVACLAQALGNTIAQASADEKAHTIEKTAADILRHYERTNLGVGKDRDAVIKLLRVREAIEAKNAGKPEAALDVCSCHWCYVYLVDLAFVTDHGVYRSHSAKRRCRQNYAPCRGVQRSA